MWVCIRSIFVADEMEVDPGPGGAALRQESERSLLCDSAGEFAEWQSQMYEKHSNKVGQGDEKGRTGRLHAGNATRKYYMGRKHVDGPDGLVWCELGADKVHVSMVVQCHRDSRTIGHVDGNTPSCHCPDARLPSIHSRIAAALN